MRAGLRDRIITLQVLTQTRDGVGEPVETWADVRDLKAQRQEGSRVIERFAAQQRFASVTTVFRVGYWPGFDLISPETHRVVFGGKPYNIHGALEIGRKDGVELLCSARGENG